MWAGHESINSAPLSSLKESKNLNAAILLAKRAHSAWMHSKDCRKLNRHDSEKVMTAGALPQSRKNAVLHSCMHALHI